VVNWLRAAAIMAQIDPVAKGYLTVDSFGHFRLPALRQLGSIDLLNAIPSQTNLLAEYTLHNLSDADFTYSGPVVGTVEILLFPLARRGAGGSGIESWNRFISMSAFCSRAFEKRHFNFP
jgi:hypothetical protein